MLEAAAENPAPRSGLGGGRRALGARALLWGDLSHAPAVPLMAMQTAATATLSGDRPPPSLADVMPRIAPRAVLLIWAAHGQEGERLNRTFFSRARAPKAVWEAPRGGHTGALEAMPREYERRVIGFFGAICWELPQASGRAGRGGAPEAAEHRARGQRHQRWDTLWGMPTVEQALAENGVTFENSFVVNPLCCPSRASLLTGRYSHSTGVYRNVPPHGGYADFRDGRTLATVLHAAGYETGFFGKYLNGYGRGDLDVRHMPPAGTTGPRSSAGRGTTTTAHGGRRAALVCAPGVRLLDACLPRGPSASSGMRTGRSSCCSRRSPPRAREATARPRRRVHAFLLVAPAELQRGRPLGQAGLHPPARPLSVGQARRAARFRREQLESALGVDQAVRRLLTTVGRAASSGGLRLSTRPTTVWRG